MWGYNNVEGIRDLVTWLSYKNPAHRKMEKKSSDPMPVDECFPLQLGNKWNPSMSPADAKNSCNTALDANVKTWLTSVRGFTRHNLLLPLPV